MSAQSQSLPFSIQPTEPTTIIVESAAGIRFRVEMILGVLSVKETQNKNTVTGDPIFEIDFNVGIKVERKVT